MTEENFGSENSAPSAGSEQPSADVQPGSRQWEIDALEKALEDMRKGSAGAAQSASDSADAMSDLSHAEESSSGISLGDLLQQLDHVREDVQDLDNRPQEAVAEPEVEEEPEAEQPSPLSLLFQAATPVQPRRASRPAGPPVVLDQDDDEDLEAPERATSEEPQDGEDIDDVEDTAVDQEDDDNQDSDSDSRRRRRRRGGRGRKRRGSEDAEGDSSSDDEQAAEEEESTEEPDSGEDEESSSSSRRRRRRRRKGSASGDEAGSDDPPNTVTKVRSGRKARDEITGVKGSTRLEAKRQRRREGREFARRRPIISEAEFLARRESVDRTMLVREHEGRTQLVVLEDGVLVEHYVARKASASLIGNVYVGKVQNVLPSMEAAFIDIGRGRNAVLYAGEVNWDAAGVDGSQRRIELALKPGDPVLVQVTKDPLGHKGARLTSQISLPGRYLVYVPGASMTGISRKLPDTERTRLKNILREVVPDDGGVIVRTAAEGASEEELRRDVERLVSQWESISKRSGAVNAPSVLHAEPDLITKVVRDIFNEDFSRLLVSGQEPWETVSSYMEQVAPDLMDRVERWDTEDTDGSARGDIFSAHRVDEQLAKALDRKVWLPSGGSLVIDRTEAMTVVDVNTGRFVGSGGNLEETVTKNNLEAAEEIVRQLRLRDVGGIVVIDFIDMVLDSNRDLVLRRLVECLGRDRTKHQVAEVTSLGLVQMTRKRVGQGLLEAFSEPCEHCTGRGYHLFDEPIVNPQQMSAPANNERNSNNNNGGNGNNNGGQSRAERKRDKEEAAKAALEAEQHKRAAADALRIAEAARKAKERASQEEGGQPEPEAAQPDSAQPTSASSVEADLAQALDQASGQVETTQQDTPVEPAPGQPVIDEPVAEAPAVEAPVVERTAAQEPAEPVKAPRARRRRRATSPATTPKPLEGEQPAQ